MKLKLALALSLCLAGTCFAEQNEISMASLLDDMTNLVKLAEFPAPAYTCKQFSSYDRASKTPDDQKTWFANGDCGQYIRVENKDGHKEFVMLDADGPGAIVRMWGTWGDGPKGDPGTVRVYIDGAEKPALETSLADLLMGKYPGLPRPISGEYSKGRNLYLPIPYAKHCKITSDKGGFYYHVGYRTYSADTKVKSFSADQITALDAQIKELAAKLEATDKLNGPGEGAATKAFDKTLAAGASVALEPLSGAMAIRRIRLNWTPTADRNEPALRAVVVQIAFDGETTVEAPLGDFFGAAPGVNPFQSLPLSVTRAGTEAGATTAVMECRWVMPFKKSAEIKLTNLGKESVTLKGEVVAAPYTWTDATMLFHAKWRIQHDLPTDPKIDWNYMTAKGKGVFAGVAYFIDNPVKDWWGEGDEKIYVDGETFPSHFGTGTEDYFGYAWCFPALFTHAYHNQARCDGPGNFGRTSLNRFHILDRIPFTKDFRFDMEMWHWKKCLVNSAVIDYWYAMPGATDGFKAITADDVTLRPAPETPAVAKVKGAIEGEEMKIISKVGAVEPQDWDATSGGRHLWWRGGHKVGDALVLGFNVAEAGTYKVFGRFLKAVDYGIAQFAINDKKAGEPIDFYNDGVIVSGEIELGSFDLKAGENTLSITITGANEKAQKSYMVGLDYLLIKK
ncbi:MAG TPA: DUF2961 domain-containing protein [Planctomycetota bacterium]